MDIMGRFRDLVANFEARNKPTYQVTATSRPPSTAAAKASNARPSHAAPNPIRNKFGHINRRQSEYRRLKERRREDIYKFEGGRRNWGNDPRVIERRMLPRRTEDRIEFDRRGDYVAGDQVSTSTARVSTAKPEAATDAQKTVAATKPKLLRPEEGPPPEFDSRGRMHGSARVIEGNRERKPDSK
jgi:hypothetical protein